MAASPTPRPTPADGAGANPASASLASLALAPPIAVAYSGGADSTALLLAALARWPGQVVALHVHHGLQVAADGFEAHVRARCAQWGADLHVSREDARPAPGASPEDAARRVRYAALARLAGHAGASCVLLGQHADDQGETVLLALSRGAGLPGLAAMPRSFERHGTRFLRPLLEVPGPALRRWLADAGIEVAEDPTNQDLHLTRNRIRHVVLPALEQALPQWRDTLARSARHAAQAQGLLDEVAAQDLAAMGGIPLLAHLRGLSRARQANVLRHWLRTRHAASASEAQLRELLDQVQDSVTRGHRLRLRVGSGHVLRERDGLRFQPASAGLASPQDRPDAAAPQ